jgi:chromate reductase
VWGEADAILFATPEFNGSVPGGLKNAIDWASRPRREAALLNKTVTVIGASTGQFGALWAQNDLRRILGIAGARVVGEALPVNRAQDGLSEPMRDALRSQLDLLVEASCVPA